ncbi:MAG TPA: MarR family transcriptional regulator [Janthinobacterium sp.]|nr:MarR family transcriptional regulator [Janthinobacterium sp.]
MRETNDNVNHSGKAPEDGVLDLIHSVMHQYRSQQYQVLRDGPHDLTHMESKVLRYFQYHPAATQSDCARHSGRDKAQLARLIATLRARGFLDGVADAADRRNMRLSLTAAGQAVQGLLQQQAERLNATAVRGLSATEQGQLLELLRRVRGNLEVQD